MALIPQRASHQEVSPSAPGPPHQPAFRHLTVLRETGSFLALPGTRTAFAKQAACVFVRARLPGGRTWLHGVGPAVPFFRFSFFSFSAYVLFPPPAPTRRNTCML